MVIRASLSRAIRGIYNRKFCLGNGDNRQTFVRMGISKLTRVLRNFKSIEQQPYPRPNWQQTFRK